jgi:hypothetical protein
VVIAAASVVDTVFAEVLALVVGLMTTSTDSVLRGIRRAIIVRREATSHAVADKDARYCHLFIVLVLIP